MNLSDKLKTARVIFTFDEAISLLKVGVSGFLFRNSQGKLIRVKRNWDTGEVEISEE